MSEGNGDKFVTYKALGDFRRDIKSDMGELFDAKLKTIHQKLDNVCTTSECAKDLAKSNEDRIEQLEKTNDVNEAKEGNSIKKRELKIKTWHIILVLVGVVITGAVVPLIIAFVKKGG